jgi:hypothetical protein
MQFMPQRAEQLQRLSSVVIAHGTMIAFGAQCRGETTDPIDG